MKKEEQEKKGFFSQTTKKVSSWLAKATLKKLIKKGAKKLAVWLTTKLSLAAIPEPVVSKILLVLSFLKDIVRKLFQKLKEKPTGAIIAGLTLLALPIIIPTAPLVGLLFSALGALSFLAGLAGGISKWGGVAVTKASSSLIQLTSGISSLLGSLTTISLPTSVVTFPLGISLLAVVTGALLVIFILISAFAKPSEEPLNFLLQKQSEYLRVEKSVVYNGQTNPTTSVPNPTQPVKFSYKIIITATKTKLTNIKIEDKVTTTQGEINNQKINNISYKTFSQREHGRRSLSPGEAPLVIEYELETKPLEKFQDALLMNVATVTADVLDPKTKTLSQQTAFASTLVTIGHPPQDCPQGWPTEHGYITQGPEGSHSHNIPGKTEAIDIGLELGSPVFATHKGKVKSGEDPVLGKYITVQGLCQNTLFFSLYAHLSQINLNQNYVNQGELIGYSGNTGQSTGPHLHYEFRSWGNKIKMGPPFIPQRVTRGCSDKETCHTSW